MSTGAGDHADGPTFDNLQTGPRRSSRPSVHSENAPVPSMINEVAETSSSTVTSPRGAPVASEKTVANPEALVADLDKHRDSPDDARNRLRSLGDLRPGSDVSLRLRELHRKVDDHNSSHALLPILTRWISLWFTKAEKARRENRSTRSTANKEQSDLDWLLKYIHDYLALGQVDFSDTELLDLVNAVLDLCLNTNKQIDINHSINILHAVLTSFDFPTEALEQTLIVLCASASNLQEPPDHLNDTLRLLVRGKLHEKAISIFYKFIRAPKAQNPGKSLSHARGAIRLLKSLLGVTRPNGRHVLDIDDFMAELHHAAEQKIFRFSIEVLLACHEVFTAQEQREELLLVDWNNIVATLQLCLSVRLGGNGTGSAHVQPAATISPTSSNDEEKDRQNDRYLRERDTAVESISKDLKTIWPSLTVIQRNLVSEAILLSPASFSDDQTAEALHYADTSGRCWPTNRQWQDNFDMIMKNFVLDSSLTASSRIQAIQIMLKMPMSKTFLAREEHSPRLIAAAETIAGQTVQTFLDQAKKEDNMRVQQALMRGLEELSFSPYLASSRGAQAIVKELQEIVMSYRIQDTSGDERAYSAAKCLVAIFEHSLFTSSQATIPSFEALSNISIAHCQSRRSRIAALRILCRIRCDSNSYMFLQTWRDSQHIAPALCRTKESAEFLNQEVLSPQRQSTSSSSLSSKSAYDEALWMYDDHTLPESDANRISIHIQTKNPISGTDVGVVQLDMTTWLMQVIRIMQADTDWETYSYILVHLGAQLANLDLFMNSLQSIVLLRQVLCDQVVNGSFREPPVATGLKRSDVVLCMVDILTRMIPYAAMKNEGTIQRGFGDDLIRAFVSGIGSQWEGTARGCIHALSVCSLEIPSSVASSYPSIIDKLSKSMTQSHLTVHILEFLAQVAALPEVHDNFNQDEVNMIFGICIQFLEKTRDQSTSNSNSVPTRLGSTVRHSGVGLRRPPYRAAMLADPGLPQYAAALAYHTMIFWFLSLGLSYRAKYVSWIIPRLIWKNAKGEDLIDEQSQVFIDLMQRTAFSDLGESQIPTDLWKPSDGPVDSASWVVGLSIVTAETAGHTGKTHVIKRQAAGTTHAVYEQLTTQLPPHHAPSHTEIRPVGMDSNDSIEVLPAHILLQMAITAAPTGANDQPVPLPKEDYVTRALDTFDRIPTVDSHKIGVLFVGPNQTEEAQYLANTKGTPDYDAFLERLGYEVSLEPPLRFNPQGLEHPRDGKSTRAWRDRTIEMVYHVGTMMPTDLEEDPQCNNKKAHIGNCHVLVIYNRSGRMWELENFKSQLNYVNIVLTTATKTGTEHTKEGTTFIPGYYNVHVMTKDGFPGITPAADPKVMSAAQVAKFVRIIALNADVFSQAWNSKDIDVEFPSTWRARLQQIKMLKERVLNRSTSGTTTAGGAPSSGMVNTSSNMPAGGRRTPGPREETPTGRRDVGLVSQLDFGKWTTMPQNQG